MAGVWGASWADVWGESWATAGAGPVPAQGGPVVEGADMPRRGTPGHGQC
jgi:hypothetical protein